MKYERHQSSSELLQSVEGSLHHGGVQEFQDRLKRGLQEHCRVLQPPSKNDEAEFSSQKPSQSGIFLTFGKSLRAGGGQTSVRQWRQKETADKLHWQQQSGPA